MDTKKFNANGQGKAKAGSNNTRVTLTAAGLAAAAAAGAGAAHIFSGNGNEVEPEKPTEEVTDEKVKPTEDNKENETAQESAQENSGTTATSSAAQDNISQPQPTTGNGANSGTSTQPGSPTQSQNPSHPQEPDHPTGGDTPQEVAEQIAHAEEIDKDDIDAPSVVEIDGFTTAYDQAGNEMQAVMAHTPDGVPLMLVDVDGDGVFEGVFDTNGNFVAQADANLTHSDMEATMDQTGGFLALNEHDKTSATEDPTNDIIDTETGTHPEMAMNERPTEEQSPEGYTGEQPGQPDVVQQEEPSADEIDNLLAELLGPDTDGESKGVSEEVLVDESDNSDSVDGSDDDSDDADDVSEDDSDDDDDDDDDVSDSDDDM